MKIPGLVLVLQSNVNLTELEEKIKTFAATFKMTEMIYDIANFIQDELIPATQSLYESMVNRLEQQRFHSDAKLADRNWMF